MSQIIADSYEILQQIGSGGGGVVYLGRHLRLGKLVVLKADRRDLTARPEVLRREYRRATCQLKLCTGGFGAYPRSRGSACFCIDLYTGKESRYERMDILGTMEPEKLPGWAKHGLLTVQQERAKKEPHKGEKEER